MQGGTDNGQKSGGGIIDRCDIQKHFDWGRGYVTSIILGHHREHIQNTKGIPGSCPIGIVGRIHRVVAVHHPRGGCNRIGSNQQRPGIDPFDDKTVDIAIHIRSIAVYLQIRQGNGRLFILVDMPHHCGEHRQSGPFIHRSDNQPDLSGCQ